LELRGGGSLTSVEADARHVLIRVESRPLVETIGEIGPRSALRALDQPVRRGSPLLEFSLSSLPQLTRLASLLAGSRSHVCVPHLSILWGDPVRDGSGGCYQIND